MSTIHLLTDIPVEFNSETLARRLHVRSGSPSEQEFLSLLQHCSDIARPKAGYRVCYIDERTDDRVVIDGVTFKSRILTVNLQAAHRVFFYTATCGTELFEYAERNDDILLEFWLEEIKQAALGMAIKVLYEDMATRYQPGKTTTMAPGSLADWPLSQQRPTFELLQEVAAGIGVTLTDSCLMVPNKSISGIRFPTEESFESCMLCERESCPGRRAPYDPDLYDDRFRPHDA